jgi:Fe2+ transport system protein FeoA
MFGLGKKRGSCKQDGSGSHKKQHRCREQKVELFENLLSAKQGKKYVIMCNPDKKTMEMGLYVGGLISVQKNDFSDPNIVIGVGESRYIIPRELAEKILIR